MPLLSSFLSANGVFLTFNRRDLTTPTGLQSKLAAFDTMWHDAASRLVVWRGNSSARWAQVLVCRYQVDMAAECPIRQVQADHPKAS